MSQDTTGNNLVKAHTFLEAATDSLLHAVSVAPNAETSILIADLMEDIEEAKKDIKITLARMPQ